MAGDTELDFSEPRPEPNQPSSNSDDGFRPDLSGMEVHRAKRQGDAYIRVVRPDPRLLKRVAPGVLRATEQASRPNTPIGRLYARLRVLAIGRPLPSEAEKVERLTKIKALAVFSSDAISSSAYATEEILIVLITAGTAGLFYSLPVAFAIAMLLLIVSFSYRQTVHAYPHGGGSYTVSKENLGSHAGLVAASALLVDYVLTVAVSIAAGTAAITSAVELLIPYRVEIALTFVAAMTLINLRGVRESGTILAVPTYLYIFSLGSVILVGTLKFLLEGASIRPPSVDMQGPTESLTLFLLLRSFAAGSVAMSGTEAISNGVPVFQPPETRNAATTLTWMSSILGVFFVGVTFLAHIYGVVPNQDETVISQVGRAVLGSSIPYLVFQATTMLILVLAANTSFAGFPRLASILAQDGFMPRQFMFRGERLAFSNGILLLGVIAGMLIILFGGETHALIPLYAVGVFVSFTFSQGGMVRHWWKTREPHWRKSLTINAVGAILTGIVLVVVASVKFLQGAWMVLFLIPLLVFIFSSIHRHYARVAAQMEPATGDDRMSAAQRQIVLVPVGDINKATLRALSYARSISSHPIAVDVVFDEKDVEAIRSKWAKWGNGTELVLLESPYRSFNAPLLAYIDELQHRNPDAFVTIILPEFLPAHWWEHILHNQTALRLKAALLFRPNTVTVDVPFHLKA